MKTNGHKKVKVLDFVDISGVSKQNIYKAGRKGTINIKNGFIDLTDSKTINYLQAQQIKKKAIAEVEASTVEAKEETVKYLPEDVQEAALNVKKEKSSKRLLEEARISKQNRDLDLKYDRDSKVLLHRDSVAKVFSKLYSIQVSKLHGFSHTVTPELAVIFKSTDNKKMIQTTELIDRAMFTALEEIKKTMNDYLESVKGEEVEE